MPLDRRTQQQELMRYRDLLLQVERFLKYGTKGTSPEVVRRQAREFNDRLSTFDPNYEARRVGKARRKLESLVSGG